MAKGADSIDETAAAAAAAAEPKRSAPAGLPLAACTSLVDLEAVAQARLSPLAAAYFGTGAETQTAQRRNRRDWDRIGLRPRVLRDVGGAVALGTSVFGAPASLPVFVAPAAKARLGHRDGELGLAQGAARMAVAQCVSTHASVSPARVAAAFHGDPQRRGEAAAVFQLYVAKTAAQTEKRIAAAREAGFDALVVTVDGAVIGKRDTFERFLAGGQEKEENVQLPPLPGDEPLARASHSPSVVWDDLPRIRRLWGHDRPLILKGLQSVADVQQAARLVEAGVLDALYLSNHGGRQLDFAPSAVQTLLALREHDPDLVRRVPIYVDGGVRHGSDVVKALCLGARAVGLGRGFLYALSAYGTPGVIKAISILSDEIQTTMRLLGVTDIAQLDESYLDLSKFGLKARL